MQIYTPNNTLIADIVPDDDSYRQRELMSDEHLVINFSSPSFLDFPLLSYTDYDGVRYKLYQEPDLVKHNSRNYEYTLKLSAPSAAMSLWVFRHYLGTTLADTKLKFPLTATPTEHVQMIVDNLNAREPNAWKVGVVNTLVSAEQLVVYDHYTISEALEHIADALQCEYEIGYDSTDSQWYINLVNKVEYNRQSPLQLSYGRNLGLLPDINRTTADEPHIGRVYVQGSSRNIDPNGYGSACLHLPSGAGAHGYGYDGTFFSDEQGFDASIARYYTNDIVSVYRNQITPDTTAEGSFDATSVYPNRVAVVGSVTVANGNYYITDNAADCPDYEQYLILSQSMTIVFQSGELAGREFSVVYEDSSRTVSGVSIGAHNFKIVSQDMDGVNMPSGTFVPAAGDKFVVFGCSLPDSYIEDAEWEMYRAAIRYLYEREEKMYSITANIDSIWARRNWSSISGKLIIGGTVKYTDSEWCPDGIYMRIMGIKENINSPYKVSLQFSNQIRRYRSLWGQLQTAQSQSVSTAALVNNVSLSAARQTTLTEQAIGELNDSTFTNLVTAVTLINQYSEQARQFVFVSNPSQLTQVTPNMQYSAQTGKFTAAGSVYLQHRSIGITTIKMLHDASEYKSWLMTAYESAVLTSRKQGYYLYAVCPSNANTGTYQLTTAPQDLLVNNVYYFICGYLEAERNSTRTFTRLYGTPTISAACMPVSHFLGTSDGIFVGDTVTELQTTTQDIEVSNVYKIAIKGGNHDRSVTLPSDPAYIGKNIIICEYNIAPISDTYGTIIRVDSNAETEQIGISGVKTTSRDYGVRSIYVSGGAVQMLGIPYLIGNSDYCRWVVISGHDNIVSYELFS